MQKVLTYTKLHQPSSIGWTGGSIGYEYQWSRLISQALSNGVNTDYAYNADGWLTGITAKRQDNSVVLDYQYSAFDKVGNILGKSTEAGTHSYGYDELYRLTSAQNPLLPAESFSYDRVGNRLTSADAASWSYNNNNALVGYDGVNFTYDANGNTVTKDESGQVTNYIYGAKDRLEQVNLPDGRVAVYKYDPFGRRISKTVDGTTTYFMYADEGLVAEMNASGAVSKTYGWKPNSTWGTDPVLMAQGGNVYFYHNDHLGTPQKMTDSAGAVVWSGTYTAFGEVGVDAASTVTNNLRFPGQYYDAETGLHYNWFRYYDSKTGRYISEDPIGFLGGSPNIYSYVLNRPGIYTDSHGLFLWVPMVAGGIVGAITNGATVYFEHPGDWEKIGKAAAIGFAAGFASSGEMGMAGIIIIGGGLGFIGNIANQLLVEQKRIDCINYRSAFFSGLAGATGGIIGNLLTTYRGGGPSAGAIIGAFSGWVIDDMAQDAIKKEHPREHPYVILN